MNRYSKERMRALYPYLGVMEKDSFLPELACETADLRCSLGSLSVKADPRKVSASAWLGSRERMHTSEQLAGLRLQTLSVNQTISPNRNALFVSPFLPPPACVEASVVGLHVLRCY